MNFARKNKVAKAAFRLEEVSLIAGHFMKLNLLGLALTIIIRLGQQV
jgi:hypothetical protein